MPNQNTSNTVSVIDKVKLDVEALEVGMFVSELDCPWEETDFFFQGFTIDSQKTIDRIRDYCQFVYIDLHEEKNLGINKLQSAGPYKKYLSTEKIVIKKQIPLEKEIQIAEKTYHGAKKAVQSFMANVIHNKSIDIQEARAVVGECMGSVSRNPDAMLLLSQLKNKDEYTSQHSLNVCLYSIVLGRALGLEGEPLETVGLCGMLHDMGKIKTPLEILNKPGKFTNEEYEIMKLHPVHGRDILVSSGQKVNDEIVQAAYSHHERLDGSGYPEGSSDSDISPFSKIVTIADVYDAITSSRVYDGARSHLEATRILIDGRGNSFDDQLVLRFIECMGLYPPGSLIEMTNGEVALLLENNVTSRLTPKLLLIMNTQKALIPEKMIDLEKTPMDKLGQRYMISNVLPQDSYGINIKKYFHRGLFTGLMNAS